MLTFSVNAISYDFAFYPEANEKLILIPGPFIELKDLSTGEFEYKYRIKKNNKWSSWSGFSKMGVWKGPESPEKSNSRTPLILAPFIYGISRSLKAKGNDVVIKNTREGAMRIGTNLSSRYYASQLFYEAGKTFSRADLGLMKIISPKFQLGGNLLFASGKLRGPQNTAQINSVHAFIQATGKHQTQNGFIFDLKGAGTVQGSLLASLWASKGWMIKKEFKISPTIGYEYLDLKTSDTRLSSTSFMAGLFAEFPFDF